MKNQKTFMQEKHAYAIGSAVASTIYAAVAQPQSETIETWVQFCLRAGDEAYAAVFEAPPAITIKSSGDPGMLTLLMIGDQLSRDDHARYGAKITTDAKAYEQKRGVVT